jgi:hypothetical protein
MVDGEYMNSTFGPTRYNGERSNDPYHSDILQAFQKLNEIAKDFNTKIDETVGRDSRDDDILNLQIEFQATDQDYSSRGQPSSSRLNELGIGLSSSDSESVFRVSNSKVAKNLEKRSPSIEGLETISDYSPPSSHGLKHRPPRNSQPDKRSENDSLKIDNNSSRGSSGDHQHIRGRTVTRQSSRSSTRHPSPNTKAMERKLSQASSKKEKKDHRSPTPCNRTSSNPRSTRSASLKKLRGNNSSSASLVSSKDKNGDTNERRVGRPESKASNSRKTVTSKQSQSHFSGPRIDIDKNDQHDRRPESRKSNSRRTVNSKLSQSQISNPRIKIINDESDGVTNTPDDKVWMQDKMIRDALDKKHRVAEISSTIRNSNSQQTGEKKELHRSNTTGSNSISIGSKDDVITVVSQISEISLQTTRVMHQNFNFSYNKGIPEAICLKTNSPSHSGANTRSWNFLRRWIGKSN